MTPNERLKLRVLHKKIQDLLIYAYARWLDEKEYEDIDDYAVAFKPTVEKLGFTFLKMTKRPFGFKFTTGEQNFQVYCNSQYNGIKSTK